MRSEPKLSHAGILVYQNASFMLIALRYLCHFRIMSVYNFMTIMHLKLFCPSVVFLDVRQRTRGSHRHANARDLSFVVLNNRRSE